MSDGAEGRQGKDQKDKALLPRAQLIRAGFEALAKQSPRDALLYFGAAIRKAKRVQLWDVEAEFYKFVTLYLHGDYREAVNRCVECLDCVKMTADIARSQGTVLPVEIVADRLADCLVQTMVLRKDTFWQLFAHFWQVSRGEFYLLKKPYSFFSALGKAWMALSVETKISYDMLKNELKPFTAFLQAQLDAAKDMLEAEEEARAAEASAETQKLRNPEQPSLKQVENDNAAFLKKASEATIMRLSATDIDQLVAICRSTRSVPNIAEIARLIDMLGPNSKKIYYSALTDNELMTSTETKLPDRDAERLHQEVLEFLDKRSTAAL